MFLCDIGNTNYHFYYHGKMWKNDTLVIDKTLMKEPLYYISVHAKREQKLIKTHKRCINIAKYIILDTCYVGMGIDRKAACLSISDGVIIDAGSAITIDVMQEKLHLGGCILPGITAYRRLFSVFSALDVDFNFAIDSRSLPQNTKDAISYGCLKSIFLLIKSVAKDKDVFLTGGDGKFFSKFLKNSTYDDTLVFRGMIKALEDYKSKYKDAT